MSFFIKKNIYPLFLIGIFTFYVFFPTNNSTLDAYAYAGYTKYNYFLFTPHHLLHNPLIFFLNFLLQSVGIKIEILVLSKIVNSIFALLNLIVLKKILTELKIPKEETLIYLLILGFSFSLWRYGTENETYIIPNTFSLLGSLFFLKFIHTNDNRKLFFSGFFTMISCLFHQLYIFWWLGLLTGSFLKKKLVKTFFLYATPFILVPIVYGLVLVFYEKQSFNFQNIFHFVLHDFIGGSVLSNFGWKGLFFQFLNSFRTFFQVHPNIYFLIKRNSIFCIPIFFVFFLCYQFFKFFFQRILLKKKEGKASLFIKTHVCIGLAIYLFAYYNSGNIEFMMALPYIIVLYVSSSYKVNQTFLRNLACVLCIWNFSYGIFPNYYYSYYNDHFLVQYMIDNPDNIYIIKNASAKNNYFYKTGLDNPKNIILYNKVDPKEIENLLKQNKCIYTDLIDKPVILNKENIINTESVSKILKNSPKTEILSYQGFYGKSFLYKVCH